MTLGPGVYRCAISVAGISDLRRVLRWENRKQGREQNLTQRNGIVTGVSAARMTRLWIRYPRSSISMRSAAPLLLIHGRDDTVLPFQQSQMMYDALHAAKKDVQLRALKEKDHGLSRSGTRLQMLQASVAFLRARNPPD